MTDQDELTPADISAYILSTYPGTDLVSTGDATFFSLDPEAHWPNFATIVTSDVHDQAPGLSAPSNLAARGLYRLNMGIGPAEFKRRFAAGAVYDYAAIDVLFPHPVYAAQRWVSIIDPSRASFESEVKPLLQIAHRLVARIKD